MNRDALVIKEEDNVATALREINLGEIAVVGVGIDNTEIEIRENIPFGHKFALKPIFAGEDIIKYGEVIGRAIESIKIGAHAHTHNIESLRGRGDLLGRKT